MMSGDRCAFFGAGMDIRVVSAAPAARSAWVVGDENKRLDGCARVLVGVIGRWGG
jgi:hypothetical protein